MQRKKLAPVPPGEVLSEEFLKPLGVSQCQVAKAISVPPRRINEIVHGKRAVTADTALRLSRYLGTSERFWLNLQARYELEVEKDRLGDPLWSRSVPRGSTTPMRSRAANHPYSAPYEDLKIRK
jgi:addiction module HigA family antidote